jgi:hypothetical protein
MEVVIDSEAYGKPKIADIQSPNNHINS